MRVAVGGFMHETNTFAPSKATYEMFERADSWPAMCEGGDVLTSTAGVNIGMSGFVEAAAGLGFELEPLVWCNAGPSAHVTDDAFERIAGRMTAMLRAAGPVDAVYLDLHGAMVTESLEDGEGELLRRVREIVGVETPIVASLDLHANVTELMFAMSDALVGFRTYPHVDMAETGGRTAGLLQRVLREGKPHKAMRRTDFLISINAQCTLVDPAKAVYEKLTGQEQEDGVWSLSFLPGFPPADIAECGPTVLVYGPSEDAVEQAADKLNAAVETRRSDFDCAYLDPDAAVAEAIRLAATSDRPIVIADTQDNPGGGGDGDTTGMLRALAAAAPTGAILGLFIDPEAAARAHAVGVGGSFEASLGGRSWPEDAPFDARLTVERLADGAFTCTGPFYKGAEMKLGPMALVRIGDTDVRAALASRKVQAADKEMFRCLGAEPEEAKILVLKSSVHFRADFGPIAAEVLVARAPGPVVADPSELPYRRLRDGVRLGPNGPEYRQVRS